MLLAQVRRGLLISAIGAVTSCGGLSSDTYWHSGDYLLIAVDVKGQMNLAVDLGNGSSIALIGPTVFSLGADDRYIVVKQHPATDQFGAFDRTVISFYVVARISGSAQEKTKGVRGPLTKAQFDQIGAASQLPSFTKTFDDLT